jgi:hypothetical protein
MLRRNETYTVITRIPGFIPRQLALDILHSHSEVITLNPLVLNHKPISAPRNAAADEYYSTWYEITQRIQYVPGMGKAGSAQITFNGCFHDMPWGLQTHTYAPMNVDLRNTYRVGGNQPGIEPPEQRELGMEELGIPRNGLYLRQDAEIKCNITMISFVKAQLKAASKEMVDRIIKKAELLDAGVLQAMMENGKLRTFNPNDRSYYNADGPNLVTSSLSPSPQFQHRQSTYSSYSGSGTASPPTQQQNSNPYNTGYYQPPASIPQKQPQAMLMELPGDTVLMHPNNSTQPPNSPGRSNHSGASSDPRWSQVQQNGPPQSLGFASELPAHNEPHHQRHGSSGWST